MKIVFDLAGVLLHWQPHELLARLLPARCITPQATLDLALAMFQGFGGDWSDFDRGTLDPGELAQRISRRTGVLLPEVRSVIDAIADELQPVPASVNLLQRLHAGGKELYFLSNMPEPYARHLEARHAFFQMFRQGVFSARVQLIKPEPAIFAHAHDAFDVGDGAAVFIDDVAVNVVAARTAGWRAIQFHDAAQCESELAEIGAIS